MMSMITKFANKIKNTFVLNLYDDFTIVEYFRKQGAKIGEDCRIEVRSLGTEPYLITIGNHCTIAPRVQFITHEGAVWVFTEERPDLQNFGTIEIGDNCFIGSGTIILPNTKIGSNTIVGAGSIVTRDIPANCVAAGNPAKTITTLDKYKEKVFQRWNKQKPENYFKDITKGNRLSAKSIQKIKYRDMEILRENLIKLNESE